MKKFILGLVAGVVLATGIVFGLDLLKVDADSNVDQGNITEQQSMEMELAWYRYHHETLSKALEGKCE